MNYEKLADMLFPDISVSPDYYENYYPERSLPDNACVTRIGPSPTGFVHLGNLYNAIIGERLAHQSNGSFFLRIEDTDNKREVPGAVNTIISSMNYFNIHFDEGATIDGDSGAYAPYRQRQRKNIYQCFAKHLVKLGLAYPCFCSEEELSEMRKKQEDLKANFGYYGEWAVYRNADMQTIEEKLNNNIPYVLRFKSKGNEKNYIEITDGIRGKLKIQENYQDFVLLKSDGIPTYHFAHVIDDHLMRTTHVIRGEEWISTLPIHIQLFDTFKWKKPIYCHTPQLMKFDGSSKRKLSKRKDPELALDYYKSEGYTPDAVWVYLLTILNSNFEEWIHDNSIKNYLNFPFSLSKMSTSGALFDESKFQDISKEVISEMSGEEIYRGIAEWSKEYAQGFYEEFSEDKEYSIKMIEIGREGKKPRKDIYSWKQGKEFLSMYYGEIKEREEYPEAAKDKETVKEILKRYTEGYREEDSQEEWFEKIKVISRELGYAERIKEYKKEPEKYRGTITDVCTVIRVAMTGRRESPDIYTISKIMGNKALVRISSASNDIKG